MDKFVFISRETLVQLVFKKKQTSSDTKGLITVEIKSSFLVLCFRRVKLTNVHASLETNLFHNLS